MPRCEQDTVLFRVFCVTLLAVALTFTLILTNVFIDIDSLLTSEKKEHAKTDASPELPSQQLKDEGAYQQPQPDTDAQTDAVYDYRPEGSEEAFRTKRSLDKKSLEHRLNNPKMKEVFTKKLSTLLEELEAAEENEKSKQKEQKFNKILNKIADSKTDSAAQTQKINQDMLHLAMHNILLQGIIGHMEFTEVYKKLHSLVKAFNQGGQTLTRKQNEDFKATEQRIEDISKELETSESKFFEELIKCEELQKQITALTEGVKATSKVPTRRLFGHNSEVTKDSDWETYLHQVKENRNPQMLIKTIIDIKTLKNKTNINPNNIKGQIKFIYNGKPIEFSGFGDEDSKTVKLENSRRYLDKSAESREGDFLQEAISDPNSNIVDAFLDEAVFSYLIKHPKIKRQFKTKRLKRSVNVKLKEVTTEKPESTTKKDDEVFIEIETHLGEGVKDEKKKKLIQQLVEKIRKAVLDNGGTAKTDQQNALGILKRAQNPLATKPEANTFKKLEMPAVMVQREMSPIISKTAKHPNDLLPQIHDQSGEVWKQMYDGPRFLSHSKAINSGEEGKVDLVYNNGIPQRVQQPLTPESTDPSPDEEANYFNMGDLKFFVKEIDGTGVSIGFNQYVGEAPDPEITKPFIDGDHLVTTYHYDDDEDKSGLMIDAENKSNTKLNHAVEKRDIHSRYKDIFDRIPPLTPGDQHENEYKVIFDKQYLPYDTYSEIIEDQDKKIQLAIKKDGDVFDDSFNKHDGNTDPLFIDDNIFEKQLRPSEIFGLANLLERRKRSPVVMKKFSNINTRRRSRINRFINTSRKTKRIVVNNNKRNKRQVDKIRIIATDALTNLPRHLDENIFVLSEENTGRNSLHEIEVQDNEEPEQEEVYNPPPVSNGYGYGHPLFSEFAHPQHINTFTARSRNNALMSKYPHLFLDEIDRSKENEDAPVFYNKLINSYSNFRNKAEIPSPPFLATPVPVPMHGDRGPVVGRIAADLVERIPKANYKLTVKIVPKNHTDLGSGFKEVHTSINKSINRNGLVYSSQVNVSELSKVEHQNASQNLSVLETPYGIIDKIPGLHVTEKSYGATTSFYPLVRHIREQQEKMKQLLKQHRQRIDAELDTLKKEKQNIESIIPSENKKLDSIDVVLPLDPPQMLHLNRDEASQLITSALMKLHDTPQLNDITTGVGTSNCSKQTTTEVATPTTTVKPTTTMEPEKQRILKSIQRNENLTNSILNKIDRNTNMLQYFLEKLSDRIIQRPEVVPKFQTRKKDDKGAKIHMKEPFFGHVMPNLEVQKTNNSLMTIPFVYAYQQPYDLPTKPNTPVASVVYQGHIHTNTVNKPFKVEEKAVTKSVVPDKREINETRFFFESIEDQFPLVNGHKAYDIARVKNNATKL